MSRLSSRSLLLTAAVSGLALGGTLWVKPALAGTATGNITLSASVPASCSISASPLSFGAFDDSTTVTADGSISVNCTNGASANITLSQGSNAESGSTDAVPLRRLSDGDGSYLSYQLYQNQAGSTTWGNTAGTGLSYTGTGNIESVPVYGFISSGLNDAPKVGSYSDTVVATVTY